MMKIIQNNLHRLWNFWPPFLFSGICIHTITPDYRHIGVTLKLRFWNANYIGTLYGGSLFSMADPFYMIMLIKNLGKDYSVLDKSASIAYLKPGRSDATAEFHITEEDLISIRNTLESQEKMEWTRLVEIKDKESVVIATVSKTLSIKKRRNQG